MFKGSFVKVLSLDPKDFEHLDETELAEVMTMVGDTLEVYEIDEYNQAWVRKEWWISEDEMRGLGIGLSGHEFELSTTVNRHEETNTNQQAG